MRIDFYLLESNHTSNNVYRVVARLLEKAYEDSLRTQILCADASSATTLDDWLWCYKKNSFLPHCQVDKVTETINPPIQIMTTASAPPRHSSDILVNLTEIIPAFFAKYQRILEIVPASQKQAARIRYQQYRAHGFSIQTHHIMDIK